jgi:hypothetical protein
LWASACVGKFTGCKVSFRKRSVLVTVSDTVVKLPARQLSMHEREMLCRIGALYEFFYEGKDTGIWPFAGFFRFEAAIFYIGILSVAFC